MYHVKDEPSATVSKKIELSKAIVLEYLIKIKLLRCKRFEYYEEYFKDI